MHNCSLQSVKYIFLCTLSLTFGELAIGSDVCDEVIYLARADSANYENTIDNCIAWLDEEKISNLVYQVIVSDDQELAADILTRIPADWPTPNVIYIAASMNHAELVDQLIARDSSLIGEKDDSGRTPLIHAVIAGARETSEILADATDAEDLGEAMVIAVSKSRSMAEMIMQRDTNWAEDPEISARVLRAAARYTDASFVQQLLNVEVSPKLKSKFGQSVAFAAVHNPNKEDGQKIWELLIASGANVRVDLCVLDESEMVDIRQNAPRWFVHEVDAIRATCF